MFNVTDRRIEQKYLQEVKQLKKLVLTEFMSIANKNNVTNLSESEVMHTFFPT